MTEENPLITFEQPIQIVPDVPKALRIRYKGKPTDVYVGMDHDKNWFIGVPLSPQDNTSLTFYSELTHLQGCDHEDEIREGLLGQLDALSFVMSQLGMKFEDETEERLCP